MTGAAVTESDALRHKLGGLGRHFANLAEDLDMTGSELAASGAAHTEALQRLDHISQTLAEAGQWLETVELDAAPGRNAVALDAPYDTGRPLRLATLRQVLGQAEIFEPDAPLASGDVDLF